MSRAAVRRTAAFDREECMTYPIDTAVKPQVA